MDTNIIAVLGLAIDIEIRGDYWFKSTIDYSGVDTACWAYTGNSGNIYYAWNLDIKGKGRRKN